MEDYLDEDQFQKFINQEQQKEIKKLTNELNELFKKMAECRQDSQMKIYFRDKYNEKLVNLNNLKNNIYNNK
jgi:hypothetical protein